MKKFFFSILMLLLSVKLMSQNVTGGKIVGTVFEKNSLAGKKPAPLGTYVFVPGISSTTTDSDGSYVVDLSSCKECRPGETIKIYVNSKVGYAEKEYVIPTNSLLKPLDIEIIDNNKVALNGIVRDKVSGRFLKGIKVSAVIAKGETSTFTSVTNDEGLFQIILKKDQVAAIQVVQLTFTGGSGSKYKDLEKLVVINELEPIKIEMEEQPNAGLTYNFKINGTLKSKIKVEKGDQIEIKADGLITVGPNFNLIFGPSGPAGLSTGIFTNYNIYTKWNHAALYFRFSEDDEWKCYTDKNENKYISDTEGFIELGINDNNQSDNSGAYNVQVVIRR